MPTKRYPSYSALPTTNQPPIDKPHLAGSHTTTPPLQPPQQRRARRTQRMVSSDLFPPVPNSPSAPLPPVVRRRQSSANPDSCSGHPAHQSIQHDPSTPSTPATASSSNENVAYRESLSVEPLALSRPRPDSTILPGSWPQDSNQSDNDSNPPLLDPRYFTAVVQRGETLQYWLPVELVIQGLPGRSCVPKGHWEKLVKLAEDVNLSSAAGERNGNVQLVTGWCRTQDLRKDGEDINYGTVKD